VNQSDLVVIVTYGGPAALNLAGFTSGTFLQQSPPARDIFFLNAGLTYRF
jgi:hypothetical protein